jgi:6-phosphogluconate dehydrogenase
MIYEGIGYSLAKTVLEIFDLLKAALNLDDDGVSHLARAWQTGAPNCFHRNKAALWTSQAARELAVAAPTIDAAAGTRMLSKWERQNDFATAQFRQPADHLSDRRENILAEMLGALRAATIITCAQGMAVLAAGSECYGFDLDRAEIAGLWKVCSGNRIAFLDEIASSLQGDPELVSLLYDDDLSEKVMEQQESLRHALWRARLLQTPAPVLMASLDYLDCDRGAWMPFNLIQSPHLADLVHR